MATPTIPNGEEYFFPIIYEGNGAGQRVGKFVPFTNSGTIAKSCVFDDGANDYLSRTSGTATSTKTFTVSLWCKRANLSTQTMISLANLTGTSKCPVINWGSGNTIQLATSGGSALNKITNRTFEDTSKFYHILVRYDLTQDASDDRVRLYVDGDQITSFGTNTNTLQKTDDFVLNSQTQHIGRTVSSGSPTQYLDGYLAEINYIDGQSLGPSSFGLTDTSTGRWIPKTVSPFPTTTTDIAVTVVDSGGNKYALDGVTQDTVTLIEGATYKFDQSDSSNSGHPLRFSTTSDGTHGGGSEYTTGVTTVGTPGSSGAYTQITVATGAPTLYYYCTNHSGMGGTANTQEQYGNNGFRLEFGTDSAMGDDTSGKENDFTPNNIDATNQNSSSPTQNCNSFGSFYSGTSGTQGNLIVSTGTSNGSAQAVAQPAFGVATGKWYWEVKITTTGAGLWGWKDDQSAGGSQASNSGSISTGGNFSGALSTGASGQYSAGSWFIDHGYTSEVNYTTVETNDVLMFAMDLDNGKGYVGKAVSGSGGTTGWFNSGNPATGVGDVGGCHRANGINKFYPCATRSDSNSVGEYNFGQKAFAATPPTGFLALQQDNLPENSKGITGFSIIKNRDATDGFIWQDSLRGVNQYGGTAPSTSFNTASTDMIQKFLKGGFETEDADAVNTSGESYVAHNWVLNNGTNVTDTSGDLSTELQVNTTAGISVANFTPSGSGTVTWAHGLGAVPEMGMLFVYNGTPYGTTYHHKSSATPWNNYLLATSSQAMVTASGMWGSSGPSSTLWSGLIGSLFSAGVPYTFYSFRGIEGFSKIGKYNANNSADGPFAYCGFKPSFLLIKSVGAISWYVIDSKRSPINPVTAGLTWDNNQVEFTNQFTIDFLSNGFKIRNGSSGSGASTNNTSYSPYLYYAVAENPFVGDGTSPVPAR